MHKNGAIEVVVEARPDVFNHNLETVPRLYPTMRPGARYFAIRLEPVATGSSSLDASAVHQVGHHGRPRRERGRGGIR